MKESLKRNISKAKNLQYSEFINLKQALSDISHRKIAQKIFNKYIKKPVLKIPVQDYNRIYNNDKFEPIQQMLQEFPQKIYAQNPFCDPSTNPDFSFQNLLKNYSTLPNLQKLKLSIQEFPLDLKELKLLEKYLLKMNLTKLSLQINIHQSETNLIFFGKIIEKLSNLTNLHLTLEPNGHPIADIQNMVNKISNLKNIDSLSLEFYNSELKDEDIKLIFKEILNFKNLSKFKLSLSENQFTDIGVEYMAQSIEQMKKLNKINLYLNSNYSMANNSIILIGKSLRKLPKLEHLWCDFFEIPVNSEGVASFFAEIQNITKLKSLVMNLENNLMENTDGIVIQNALKKLHNLEKLALCISNENLGFEFYKNLCLGLKSCKKLINLDLELNPHEHCTSNEFDEIISSLPYGLQICKLNIHKFDPEENSLQQLKKFLLNNTSLTHLNLKLNYEKLNNNNNLIEGISKLVNLKHLELELEQAEIGEKGAIKLGEAISQLIKLEYLELSLEENSITLKGLLALEKGIANLRNLNLLTLGLNQNKISIPEQQDYSSCFSETFKSLPMLQELSLSFENNDLNSQYAQEICKQISQIPTLETFTFISGIEYSDGDNDSNEDEDDGDDNFEDDDDHDNDNCDDFDFVDNVNNNNNEEEEEEDEVENGEQENERGGEEEEYKKQGYNPYEMTKLIKSNNPDIYLYVG